jgi:hypothetical protein
MNKLITLAAATLLSLSGCVVHSYDYDEPAPVVVVETPVNYAPTVYGADAGVYWDGYYGDDIWYFEASVDDLDTPYDVVSVWADVYDEYAGGVYVESFELFPTDDPYFWYSDWLGRTTLLDPFYPGYTVDIVAYDTYEDFGFVTLWPATY